MAQMRPQPRWPAQPQVRPSTQAAASGSNIIRSILNLKKLCE